jgi:hypothetical protein
LHGSFSVMGCTDVPLHDTVLFVERVTNPPEPRRSA